MVDATMLRSESVRLWSICISMPLAKRKCASVGLHLRKSVPKADLLVTATLHAVEVIVNTSLSELDLTNTCRVLLVSDSTKPLGMTTLARRENSVVAALTFFSAFSRLSLSSSGWLPLSTIPPNFG